MYTPLDFKFEEDCLNLYNYFALSYDLVFYRSINFYLLGVKYHADLLNFRKMFPISSCVCVAKLFELGIYALANLFKVSYSVHYMYTFSSLTLNMYSVCHVHVVFV